MTSRTCPAPTGSSIYFIKYRREEGYEFTFLLQFTIHMDECAHMHAKLDMHVLAQSSVRDRSKLFWFCVLGIRQCFRDWTLIFSATLSSHRQVDKASSVGHGFPPSMGPGALRTLRFQGHPRHLPFTLSQMSTALTPTRFSARQK